LDGHAPQRGSGGYGRTLLLIFVEVFAQTFQNLFALSILELVRY